MLHLLDLELIFFLASLEFLVRLLFKRVLYLRASYNSENTVTLKFFAAPNYQYCSGNIVENRTQVKHFTLKKGWNEFLMTTFIITCIPRVISFSAPFNQSK